MKNKSIKYSSPKESFGFSLRNILEIKDDALVVLDANVLLLPFTTNVKNISAIESVYSKLCDNNQIFLPSQAVREYLDNRATKISDINEALDKKSNQSFNYVGKQPLLESLSEFRELTELEQELKTIVKKYQDKIRATMKSMHAWGWNDPVSSMYHKILADRVLDDSHIDHDKLNKDLEFRNENNIPPGYKDKAKSLNKAGDLMIWYEILDLAITNNKDLIFVSVDEKPDWWHQSGKSPLYPRFELVDEFREKTGGRSFHIVSLSKLLEIFDTAHDVVESVRNTEEKAKEISFQSYNQEGKNNDPSYDLNDEYRLHLNIPPENGIISFDMGSETIKRYNIKRHLVSEFNADGNIIENYYVFDRVSIFPPFERKIYSEKVSESSNR